MELRHLRYFVAIADAGTVVAAAAALRVSQPALSQQLRDLEREVGVPLFERLPRGVRLTLAGREFLRHARATLAGADRAVAGARRVARDPGSLRVGWVEYGAGHVAFRAAVAEFRRRHPAVALTVDPAPYFAHPEAVREERLDVGFYGGALPDAPALAADLAAGVLLAERIEGVLLPQDHALAAAPAVDPADLTRSAFLCAPEAAQPETVGDVLGRLRQVGWRGRIARESLHPAQMTAMVAAGVGWAAVPGSMRGAAPAGAAYRPLVGGAGAPYDLHVLRRAGDDSALGAEFEAVLRAAAAEHAAPAGGASR